MESREPYWKNYDRQYREFQNRENVPIYTELMVDDVRTLEVAEWERTGGRGCFINLYGMEDLCDIQVHEIPAAQRLNRQRHLHDMLVYVVSGLGTTSLGSEGNDRIVEWQDGSLFYLPRNTPYVHANTNEDDPARLLTLTSLPLLYTFLKDDEIIWNVDSYDQWSRLQNDERYSGEASIQLEEGTNKAYWDADYISDTSSFDKLQPNPDRGAGGQTVIFPFSDITSLHGHMSEFPPGKYKKAHRHLSGANLMILSGSGYSYMWQEGESRTRIDWSPYSLFTPPTMWYHQHFNTSEDNARYLVFHGPIKESGMRGSENDAVRGINPVNQIEYYEEDPEIREEFQRELKAKGILNRMDASLYEK